MVMNLKDAAQDLADQITAFGVDAVIDPRDLNLPGVLVDIGTVTFDTFDVDTYAVTWDVYLVARNNGAPEALDVLGDMLAKLRGPMRLAGAEPLTLQLPNHGADPMPALLIRLDTRVTP